MNKLVFLGTGSAAHLERQLTSLCITSDKGSLLIDCGDEMGTVRQLHEAGIDLVSVNDVFITHRHADHVSGMSQFLFLKMLEPSSRVRVWGPVQAVKIVEWFSLKTHDFTFKNRNRISFHPMKSWETVTLTNGMRVTAAKVKHGKPVTFAVRVDTGKTSVVFTADMQPCRNFDRLARGATVVIHECYGLAEREDLIHSLGHSTAEDAALAARRVGAQKLFLTHLPTRDYFIEPSALLAEAHRHFRGEVYIAEDLMVVNL